MPFFVSLYLKKSALICSVKNYLLGKKIKLQFKINFPNDYILGGHFLVAEKLFSNQIISFLVSLSAFGLLL